MVQWLSLPPWSLLIKNYSNIIKNPKKKNPTIFSFRRDAEGEQKLHLGLLKSWLWPVPWCRQWMISLVAQPPIHVPSPVLKIRTTHQHFLEIKVRMAKRCSVLLTVKKISTFREWEKHMGTWACFPAFSLLGIKQRMWTVIQLTTLLRQKLGNKKQVQAGPSRTGSQEGVMGTSEYRTVEDCKVKHHRLHW